MGALLVLVVVVVVLLLSPVGFPWIVRWGAEMAGVEVREAGRRGWHRVQLRDVRFSAGAARVTLGTVEVPQPLAWISRLARRGQEPAGPAVEVADWAVILPPGVPPESAGDGLGATPRRISELGPMLRRLGWLGGPVMLSRGRIEAASRTWLIPTATVGQDGLSLSATLENRDVQLTVRPGESGAFEIQGRFSPHDGTLVARLSPDGEGWAVAATLAESGHRAVLDASFGADSWTPESATVQGELPAVVLPDPFQGTIRSRMEGSWRRGEGSLELRAEGETRIAGLEGVVPLTARATVGFTANSLDLTRLDVDSRILRLHLDRSVAISLGTPWNIPPATLDFEAQLDGLGIPGGRGRISGQVVSLGSSATGPRARFSLQGEGVGVSTVECSLLSAAGVVEWPRIRVETLEARFPAGGRLTAHGEADLVARECIDGELTWDGLIPGVTGPDGWTLPGVSVRATVSGPFTNLASRFQGRTLSPLGVPGVPPLDVSLGLNGRGFRTTEWEVSVATGEARMLLAGSLGRDPVEAGSWTARIGTLGVRRGGLAHLDLTTPFELRAGWPGEPTADVMPEMALTKAHLKGAAGDLELAAQIAWPGAGKVHLVAGDFSPAFLGDWWSDFPAPLASLKVSTLDAALEWDRGPIEARVELAAGGVDSEAGAFELRVSGRAGMDGVRLSDVRLELAGAESLVADLALPVRFQTSPTGIGWEPVPGGRLGGFVEVPAHARLWDGFTAKTGVSVRDPSMRMDFGGTVEEPELRLVSRVGKLGMDAASPVAPLLSVENLELSARATLGEVVIETLRLRHAGQEVRATARLPFPRGALTNVWTGIRQVDWRLAEADISVPRAELGPLIQPWRDLLQPVGTWQGEAQWRDGRWRGWLEIAGAALQPRDRLGTIRDIAIRATVDGTRVTLERGGASLNGQPVTLSGWSTLPVDVPWLAEIRVAATNLTLVRSTEALLRADLDLALVRTNPATAPGIAGTLLLRNSVIMLDVRDLVGVNLERPDQRPPYFSVGAEPVKDWTLDVHVHGSKFARVLSPAFRGTVSADARLLGTLGQPRILGEGVVDSGQIVFPFGQLRVSQVRVRFTEANPYRPQIQGGAEGMNFGYAVSLEMDGNLDDPRIRISTVPPMNTRAALQMLTTGTLPRGEYSFSGAARVQKVGAYLANDLVSNLMGDRSEEPRLSVQSGQRVTAQGQLTYGVEYRLSDHWSLVGEYDRWGQFNAGVRWRLLDR